MADPKGVKFYYAGELPAHHTFFSTDGMAESFDFKREFTLSNPMHVQRAEALVEAGILSTTKPKAEA